MACVDTGWDFRDSYTGLPCSPSANDVATQYPSAGTTPKIIATLPTGVNVSQGQTTLDKILSSVLSGLALVQGAGYVPTTAHPQAQSAATVQQQTLSFEQQLAMQRLAAQNSTGGKFGDSIQKFITENTGLLLVGVVAVVLFKSGRK